MPKTVAPGTIDVPGVDTFATNAVPDPFDARDLEYRPRAPGPAADIDQRAAAQRYVSTQSGQSCTGHAGRGRTVLATDHAPCRAHHAPRSASARTCSTGWPAATTSSRAKPRPARRCAGRVQGLVQPRRRARGSVAEPEHADRAGPATIRQPAGLARAPAGGVLPGQPVPPRRRPVGHHASSCAIAVSG